MVQTMGLHGSNDGFAWFKRKQVLSILFLALISVFILPSSYGSPERPMYKGFEAWEDGAFILPSSSHIPLGICKRIRFDALSSISNMLTFACF